VRGDAKRQATELVKAPQVPQKYMIPTTIINLLFKRSMISKIPKAQSCLRLNLCEIPKAQSCVSAVLSMLSQSSRSVRV